MSIKCGITRALEIARDCIPEKEGENPILLRIIFVLVESYQDASIIIKLWVPQNLCHKTPCPVCGIGDVGIMTYPLMKNS
jgi:hypothetical protein